MHAEEHYVLMQAEALCCVSLHDHCHSARLPAQFWSVQRHTRRPGAALSVEPRHPVSSQLPCFLKACVLLRSSPELMGSSPPPVGQRHFCRMSVCPVSISHCAEWSACTACCCGAMCFQTAADSSISFGSVISGIMALACTCAGSSPAQSSPSLPSLPSLRTSRMLRATASMASRLSARAWAPVQLPFWVSFLLCLGSQVKYAQCMQAPPLFAHLLVWKLQQGYTAPWQGKEGPAQLDA